MKKELIFPKIDSFSLSVLYEEPLCDTESNAVLLIAEKSSTVILRGRVYALSKGDALISLPYSYLRQKEKADFFPGYQIAFPVDFLRTISSDFYLKSANGGLPLSIPLKPALRLLSVADALASGTLIPIYALSTIFSVLETEAMSEPDCGLEIPRPKLLRRALTYIEETTPNEIDTAMLAARYEVSQSTLLRAFRTHLATTPHKYALALRALYAARREEKR